MIQLKNIEKCYETKAGKNYVLRQINLDIEEGDFVTFMGPSAAGKTTLLNILGMLDGDWEGEYYLFDHAVHDLKPKERMALNKQYIGFVFQNFNLLDTLTVYENLDVPLSYRNIKGSERASIVCDTLDRFGIVGKKDLFPSQLSGGQQQLVGVARAVIANPKLLLGGRADRQSALDPGRGDHGPVQEAQPRGHDDHPGHPQRQIRRLCQTHRSAQRRVDGERVSA